jgi:hemerythrin
MEWKKEYAVGIDEIDEQHQGLFDMVRKLAQLIERKQGHGPEVDSLIQFLKVFTVTHFKFEEMCMAVRKCPLAQKNLKAHTFLIDYVGEFEKDYKSNGSTLDKLNHLHEVLSKWLVNHICKIDLQLRKT